MEELVTLRNARYIFLISNFRCVLNVLLFWGGGVIPPGSEFYVPTFRNTSIVIRGVSRMNNWDEIAGVFIHVKVNRKPIHIVLLDCDTCNVAQSPAS